MRRNRRKPIYPNVDVRELNEYPKYVALVDGSYRCGLRLSSSGNRHNPLVWEYPDTAEYYRDAGAWSVTFVELNGHLYVKTKCPELQHANGMEIIPITEEEWRESNAGYIEWVENNCYV